MNPIITQPIIPIIIPLIALLGLFLGVIVSYFTKEEMDAGRKWFILMQSAIFIIVISLITNYYKISMAVKILIYFFILVILLFRLKSWIYYLILSIILGISYNTHLYPAIASLIFLYGLPTGSFLAAYKFRLSKFPKILIKSLIITHSHFIIISSIISYLIS